MKLLLTGELGYIGSVVLRQLLAAGHQVLGLDCGYYADGVFDAVGPPLPQVAADLRDVQPEALQGVEAVVHLAALSNDPLGELDAQITDAINHRAAQRLALVARHAGCRRFVFASSCSNYGASDGALLDEQAPLQPVTAYGESKVAAEQAIMALATDQFSPVSLRFATAYGVSPHLRADIVVNNLVGHALLTGRVTLQSDGQAWRPLIHVEDISRTILAVLTAPREQIHGLLANVGTTAENHRVSDLAELVAAAVPGVQIVVGPAAAADRRNYRVDCAKLFDVLPQLEFQWTVVSGIAQLVVAMRRNLPTFDEFFGPRFTRVARLRQLLGTQQLDETLRWRR